VIVPGAIAVFECMPCAWHLGGDHVIYVGRVAGIHMGAVERLPLTFHRGDYTVPVNTHLTIESSDGEISLHGTAKYGPEYIRSKLASSPMPLASSKIIVDC
jgi:hypothetical protein